MSYDLVEIAGRVQRLERDNRRLKLGAGALVAVLVALPLVAAVLPPQNPFRQQQEVPQRVVAREFQVLDENGTVRAGLGEDGLAFFNDLQEDLTRLAPFGLDLSSPAGTSRVYLGAFGLVFKDEGEARSLLDTDGLRLYDEQGEVRTFLGEDWLGFYDEQGEVRVALRTEDGLRFNDEQGTLRAGFSGAGLAFDDEQGTRRASFHEGGLVVHDEQGTPRTYLSTDWLAFDDEQGALRLQLGRVTVVNSSTKAETTYPAALVLFDEEGNVIARLPR